MVADRGLIPCAARDGPLGEQAGPDRWRCALMARSLPRPPAKPFGGHARKLSQRLDRRASRRAWCHAGRGTAAAPDAADCFARCAVQPAVGCLCVDRLTALPRHRRPWVRGLVGGRYRQVGVDPPIRHRSRSRRIISPGKRSSGRRGQARADPCMDVTSQLRLFRATAGMRFFTQEGPLQLIAPVGIGVEFVALCQV